MRTKVYIGTSLDGFIARNDGDLAWLESFANEEAIQSYEQFIRGIDAILIGRGTFEKVLSFPEWPYERPVFILSKSLKELPATLNQKAKLIAMEPASLLLQLEKIGYSGVYLDGGKLIQSFLQADLVDEMVLSRVPVLIGRGIPLFGELPADRQFKHLRTEVQSNGLVRSYYERERIAP